jgi:hypothetical protein
MQLTFRSRSIEQQITLAELNEFESLINYSFPEDYRQHMLSINGGIVEQDNNAHVSNPAAGNGIAYFYPIKYGGYTMEKAHLQLTNLLPTGYISIGTTRGGGEIIMSLNNDGTYGNIKERYSDGEINDLSSSFTQLLNDQVESVDY